MVRDVYFYALALIAAGVIVGWFAQPVWALAHLLLAGFFLWFFRDPDRVIPDAAGGVGLPAGGGGTGGFFFCVGGGGRGRIILFFCGFFLVGEPAPRPGVAGWGCCLNPEIR